MNRTNHVCRLLPLVCVMLLSSSLPVRADIVTFRLSGEIVNVPAPLWPLVDHAGSVIPFFADVTWDTGRDASLEMEDGALYFQGVSAFTTMILDTTYTMVRPNQGQLWSFNNSHGTDRIGSYLELAYGSFSGPSVGPQQYRPWNIEFGMSFETDAWDVTRLPGEIRSTTSTAGHMNSYFETPAHESGGIVLSRVTDVHQVPEPTTLMLLGIGGGAAALWSRRRSR